MIQSKQYVPLIKSGVAEVGAYRNLFPDVKEATFPVFVVRPWQNANHLQFTIDKILEAVEGHPFGFALDAQRNGHDSAKEAQEEFDVLFDQRRGFRGYFDLLEKVSGAVPVLIPTHSPTELLSQIGNADDLGRGLIVHQRRGAVIPLSEAILNLPPLPTDTMFLVDAGWSRNYLDLESWAVPFVGRIADRLPDAEISVVSSSFPDSFSKIIGAKEEFGSERRLFAACRQRYQQANITYGDWGSTRPTTGGGGGYIPSRIDVPTLASWHIFREDPDNDRGFAEVCWLASRHNCFQSVPDCWGRQMIAVTAETGEGLDSRPLATQVRINMHMTLQSGAASAPPTDEVPYED